jgi:acyl-CoA synthetase (AMP-forming)/AMP-acid ligase II
MTGFVPALVPWGSDYATLVDRFGEREAVATPDGTSTFGDLIGRAAAIATHLHAAGVASGEPVATFLRNSRQAVWAGYGVTLAGACETALNANLAPAEIAYCVGLAGVKHVVTDARSAPSFSALGVSAHIADEVVAESHPLDRRMSVAGEAWGKILFTSGTTGRPKAIVYSHHRRWLGNILQRAHLPFVPEKNSRVLLMTPYTHGASLITYAFLDHGASIYLMDGVRLDIVRDLLERRMIDAMFAPPTVLAKITQALAGKRYDCLRVIFTGTATLTPTLYRAVRAMFGSIVRVTYGKSEMINPITVLPPAQTDAFFNAHPQAAAANLGWPASGVEIAIRDESGADCAAGTTGEIFLRSPHMLSGFIDSCGYHALAAGEWHATGDLGYLAESGALFFVSRAHDLIKSGGYKIFPQEVELALAGASDGALVAVVGVPSDYWGEVIVAVAENAPPAWSAHAAAACEALTRYKRPRAFITLDVLPRVGQDKISRKRVVEALMQRYRLEDGPHPKLTPRG